MVGDRLYRSASITALREKNRNETHILNGASAKVALHCGPSSDIAKLLLNELLQSMARKATLMLRFICADDCAQQAPAKETNKGGISAFRSESTSSDGSEPRR